MSTPVRIAPEANHGIRTTDLKAQTSPKSSGIRLACKNHQRPFTAGFLLSLAAALLLCALGLGAFNLVVRFVANPFFQPQRDTGMHRDKLRDLGAVAAEIDVLVVGSSRLLHGFDPRVFAEETARLGQPLRAFNFSLQRLLLWEQVRVLDDALALPGFKPKLVLLEPAVGLGIAPENFTHARTIEFETPAAWRLAVSGVLGSQRSPAHKAWNLGTHSVVAALHLAHYGLYNEIVFPPAPFARPDEEQIPPEALGFLARADRPTGAPPPPELVAQRDDYLRRFSHDSANAGPLPEAWRKHFANLRDRLRERAIRVVFVQPPQLGFTTGELRTLTFQFAAAMSDGNGDSSVLSYLDPSAHPGFFEPRRWMDYNHLTVTGARLFTRVLARDLVDRELAAAK